VGRPARLASRPGGRGWPARLDHHPVSAEAYACDAQIAPIVTGYVDPSALDAMIRAWLTAVADPANGGSTGPATPRPAAENSRTATSDTATRDPMSPAALAAATRELTTGQPLNGEPLALPRWARKRLADILLRYAADALSGPGGLASFLRTSLLPGTLPEITLPDPLAAVSLPLDVGTGTATIPALAAPRGDRAGPPLRVPRLHPAARRLPRPSSRAQVRRRRDRAGEPRPALLVPSPHSSAPLGLDYHAEWGWHDHSDQPGR
jgi:hypothetical protein